MGGPEPRYHGHRAKLAHWVLEVRLRWPGLAPQVPKPVHGAASWDFPADMPSYDQYGSGRTVYGTEANFAANYELDSGLYGRSKRTFLTQETDMDWGVQRVRPRYLRLRRPIERQQGILLYGRAHATGRPQVGQRLGTGGRGRAVPGQPEPAPRPLGTTSPAAAGQDAADGVRATQRVRFSPPARGGHPNRPRRRVTVGRDSSSSWSSGQDLARSAATGGAIPIPDRGRYPSRSPIGGSCLPDVVRACTRVAPTWRRDVCLRRGLGGRFRQRRCRSIRLVLR